jgi:ATP-dependent Clp protease ATP-binding subunit ClpB
MDFEKYTDRSRGFIQSAQSLAQREGHQQFATEHLLKVLLDDPEGLAAGLIDRAGGARDDRGRACQAAEDFRRRRRADLPRSGFGAGVRYCREDG